MNITQEELAERLNVTRAAVSNWEVGRNYPDIQLLLKISDELNISWINY
nr:helix-turn-helix transcriptional regulator [Carnobacterium mobile]